MSGGGGGPGSPSESANPLAILLEISVTQRSVVRIRS